MAYMTYNEIRNIIDENGLDTINILKAELTKEHSDGWKYYQFENWEIQVHNEHIWVKSNKATEVIINEYKSNQYKIKLIDDDTLYFEDNNNNVTVKIKENNEFVIKLYKKYIGAIGGATQLINEFANNMSCRNSFIDKILLKYL